MKVLIIQDELMEYNIYVFNELNKHFDITLLCGKTSVDKSLIEFKLIISPLKQIFKFIYFDINVLKLMKQHDKVIYSFHPVHLSLFISSILFGLNKCIYYGIGVSASYTTRYDSNQLVAKCFSFYLRFIKAAIFYSSYPKDKYIKMGLNSNKLFVAENSVYTIDIDKPTIDDKKYLIFVGSVYPQKGLDILIDSYFKAYNQNKDIYELLLIGKGEKEGEIKQLIQKYNLSHKVKMLGPIYDDKILSVYFSKSILSISPNQAGLSVLKSMAYYCPYCTKIDAITGGEIFNIVNGQNGILFSKNNELVDIIIDTYNNKEKYYNLALNAHNHFKQKATINHKIQGFIDAINYEK